MPKEYEKDDMGEWQQVTTQENEQRYYRPEDLMRVRPSHRDCWGSVLVFRDGTEWTVRAEPHMIPI
jgi:hypothetical protein